MEIASCRRVARRLSPQASDALATEGMPSDTDIALGHDGGKGEMSIELQHRARGFATRTDETRAH